MSSYELSCSYYSSGRTSGRSLGNFWQSLQIWYNSQILCSGNRTWKCISESWERRVTSQPHSRSIIATFCRHQNTKHYLSRFSTKASYVLLARFKQTLVILLYLSTYPSNPPPTCRHTRYKNTCCSFRHLHSDVCLPYITGCAVTPRVFAVHYWLRCKSPNNNNHKFIQPQKEQMFLNILSLPSWTNFRQTSCSTVPTNAPPNAIHQSMTVPVNQPHCLVRLVVQRAAAGNITQAANRVWRCRYS
jgi:hypothetical protein